LGVFYIYVRVNIDLIVSSKWQIRKLTCTMILHNETTMTVSMVIKGKRY
jgi:hypothetical protein